MFDDGLFFTSRELDYAYVDFHSAAPISPKGFTITTASDISVFPGRNPTTFELYAKKSVDDGIYVLIDRHTLDLPTQNVTRKSYTFSDGGKEAAGMQYFRIVISDIKDHDAEWMQFSEFEFDY